MMRRCPLLCDNVVSWVRNLTFPGLKGLDVGRLKWDWNIHHYHIPGFNCTNKSYIICCTALPEVLYSSNHNLLRTIGFIAIIAADSYLHRFVRLEVMQLAGVSNAHIDLIQLYIDQSIPSPEPTKVRNLRPGGTIIVGPPCSTWVFLWPGFSIFCLTTRSVE